MELVPWRPFRELSSFRKEMGNFWSRFFGEAPFVKTFTEAWLPSVDISGTKNSFIVKTELPGLEAKDVNASISEDLPDHHRGEEKGGGRERRASLLRGDIRWIGSNINHIFC